MRFLLILALSATALAADVQLPSCANQCTWSNGCPIAKNVSLRCASPQTFTHIIQCPPPEALGYPQNVIDQLETDCSKKCPKPPRRIATPGEAALDTRMVASVVGPSCENGCHFAYGCPRHGMCKPPDALGYSEAQIEELETKCKAGC
ncbi:hypothetical protein BT63DRAFT_97759 [Microthyrium microscopicum]|uniref:Uncharacterized protein n=1 Tax=Microthyrium microscopicum TaxID=703497 RepID=A0A6A6TYI8_9PEZI|nr:hypothetical protein BT63DRAFT_97759 [Microthyrium microscopicum]